MSIELHGLCKSFDKKQVFFNLCHRFEDGSITCITGPSGCGKTTLLRILLGLTRADSGTVSGLPAACSAVFQEDRLLETSSALTNVRIALKRPLPRTEILSALEAVHLGKEALQPVSELSGGMRRRVAIVRAMLSDAPLLLMDEPFRGLDPATRELVIDFVLSRRKGRTAIIVTHDAEETALLGGQIWKFE